MIKRFGNHSKPLTNRSYNYNELLASIIFCIYSAWIEIDLIKLAFLRLYCYKTYPKWILSMSIINSFTN